MIKEVEERTGVRPEEYLVDGGFTDKKTVDHCEREGVTLFGPVPGRWGKERSKAQPKDSPAVKRWRKRMGTQEAKEIYKERAPTSERVNADVRTRRTLDRLLVRGTGKVMCVALWNALAYNIFALADPDGKHMNDGVRQRVANDKGDRRHPTAVLVGLASCRSQDSLHFIE